MIKIGDLIKLRNNDEEIDETLWEVLGFETKGGVDFITLMHPEVGGTFSFRKDSVVENE